MHPFGHSLIVSCCNATGFHGPRGQIHPKQNTITSALSHTHTKICKRLTKTYAGFVNVFIVRIKIFHTAYP